MHRVIEHIDERCWCTLETFRTMDNEKKLEQTQQETSSQWISVRLRHSLFPFKHKILI